MSLFVKILQFIASPAGVVLMIVAFLIVPLLILWPWQSRKPAANISMQPSAICDHLHLPGPPHSLAKDGDVVGPPFLHCSFGVPMNKRFFFGHPHCFNYTLVGFWRIPKATVTNGDASALIGADDPQMLDRLQQVLTEHALPQDLLLYDYSCLRVRRGRSGGVARYWGVHKDVYEHPELLEHQLEGLFTILDRLQSG